MTKDERTTKNLMAVINMARSISEDLAEEVESLLVEGVDNPLSIEEKKTLLFQIVTNIKETAMKNGDQKTINSIGEDIDEFVDNILKTTSPSNKKMSQAGRASRKHTVQLVDHNGILPSPVIPSPWFHGKEIPMQSGYVKTRDLELWEENVRLDIHIGQFKEQHKRSPSSEELIDIMLSKIPLKGVTPKDNFKILELARSIAINGVRKAPIIDIDGTLLDGNRRVTACYLILNSNEFRPEVKKNLEYIFVWQLLPQATDEDRRRVIVSLNFEDDHKEPWPDYVKARKVYEEWESMLATVPVKPGPQALSTMKRELSEKYALGPNTVAVNRYIKMVEWANDFEDYHIEERRKDKFEVQHKSSEYFQYFDELSSGVKPGGVAYALNQDDGFKKLAFTLLYDDKFKNWPQIRKLRYIYENDEAKDRLRKARDTEDLDDAQELVDEAIAIADAKRADKRSLGANTRIESFVKWLEELPVKSFRDEIRPENLRKLLEALELVKSHAETILDSTAGVENGKDTQG